MTFVFIFYISAFWAVNTICVNKLVWPTIMSLACNWSDW